MRACDPNRKVLVRERVELHNFADNDGEGERLLMNRRLEYDKSWRNYVWFRPYSS